MQHTAFETIHIWRSRWPVKGAHFMQKLRSSCRNVWPWCAACFPAHRAEKSWHLSSLVRALLVYTAELESGAQGYQAEVKARQLKLVKYSGWLWISRLPQQMCVVSLEYFGNMSSVWVLSNHHHHHDHLGWNNIGREYRRATSHPISSPAMAADSHFCPSHCVREIERPWAWGERSVKHC